MGSTTESVSGRGILFVNSKIARHDLIDEAKFLEWYDDDHIPEILDTSGVSSALRFKDADPDAEKPYLAVYPMSDVGFTQTPEFQKIRVHSDMLPGGNSVYDLCDFDVRVYALVQVYEPKGDTKGKTRSIIPAQMGLGPDVSDDEYDRFYREEHLAAMARYPGFLRATRYKLLYARSNAQSRALKGLEAPAEEPPQPPKWLALHEFSDESVDMETLYTYGSSDWTTKVVGGCEVMRNPIMKIARTHGEGTLFHGVDA